MDRHHLRYALLKISLLTLAASTWVFWSFIFFTRPEDSDENTLSSLVRLPASIPRQIPALEDKLSLIPHPHVNEPIQMDVVAVKCWDEADDREEATSARWIRLTGSNCGNKSQTESMTIRNLSNGYVATIFSTSKHALTTDFIPLINGRNEIQIRFDKGDGQSIENQIAFVRE